MESMPEWVKPELIWFIVGLVLLLAEFALPGLVVFFFGIGAWLVALICFITDIDINLQLILFLVISFLTLVLLRKKLKSMFFGDMAKFKNLEDQIDDFKGKKVRVVREIIGNQKGKIDYNGTLWDAESDVEIDEGIMVEIIDKNNITFKVKPIE